ncbi:MAG: response regulator [Acidobacteria bacterium]|nr:response regulator [Acidobacteriota bacterium]
MELGSCHWHEGTQREGRDPASAAAGRLTRPATEIKVESLLRSAAAEKLSARFHDALRLLIEAMPLCDASSDHALRGRFHSEYAQVLGRLGTAEGRRDYMERALREYASASHHFEQAGRARCQAYVENDLGFFCGTMRRFAEAHERLDRAQALFTSLKDRTHLAQVDDTRGRVLLAEGQPVQAEKFARAAAQALSEGANQFLLAEALTTHGVALARLGEQAQALRTLQDALAAAEQAGSAESAGLAALTIVEELGERLTVDELGATYERALDHLASARDPATKDRLLASARRVLFLAAVLPTSQSWENFSLKEALRRYEARIIERALRDADRSVTRAARMLGFRNHTSLIKKLKRWHEGLLHERAPARERRQSLMFIADSEGAQASAVTILHVEDNRLVASAVKETLELEGWQVESLSDGALALEELRGEKPYDVLVFDQELPGLSGLELVAESRRLEHRQQTPIIMLSAGNVEREARREGVNAFLRKPEEIALLTETVARLLARKPKGK